MREVEKEQFSEEDKRGGVGPVTKLILRGILLVVVLFNVMFVWLYYDRIIFPDQAEIIEAFGEVQNNSSKEQRDEGFYQIITSVRGAYDSKTDTVVDHLAGLIVEYYQKTHDDAVLIALDRVRLDGGFANTMCGVYSNLLLDKGFLARVQNEVSAQNAFSRCVGLSVSKEQFGRAVRRFEEL